MVNCSALDCCRECITECIWGQGYQSAARCVNNPSEIGAFILIEVHPGQSCMIPGLEQGKCHAPATTQAPTTLQPTMSPNQGESSYAVIIIIVIALVLLVVGLLFSFFKYRSYRRQRACNMQELTTITEGGASNAAEDALVTLGRIGSRFQDVPVFFKNVHPTNPFESDLGVRDSCNDLTESPAGLPLRSSTPVNSDFFINQRNPSFQVTEDESFL